MISTRSKCSAYQRSRPRHATLLDINPRQIRDRSNWRCQREFRSRPIFAGYACQASKVAYRCAIESVRPSKSGRGQPHSKTLARALAYYSFRKVWECGCPLPLLERLPKVISTYRGRARCPHRAVLRCFQKAFLAISIIVERTFNFRRRYIRIHCGK